MKLYIEIDYQGNNKSFRTSSLLARLASLNKMLQMQGIPDTITVRNSINWREGGY